MRCAYSLRVLLLGGRGVQLALTTCYTLSQSPLFSAPGQQILGVLPQEKDKRSFLPQEFLRSRTYSQHIAHSNLTISWRWPRGQHGNNCGHRSLVLSQAWLEKMSNDCVTHESTSYSDLREENNLAYKYLTLIQIQNYSVEDAPPTKIFKIAYYLALISCSKYHTTFISSIASMHHADDCKSFLRNLLIGPNFHRVAPSKSSKFPSSSSTSALHWEYASSIICSNSLSPPKGHPFATKSILERILSSIFKFSTLPY